MAVLTLLRQLQEDWQAEMCMINNRPRGLLETVSWQAEGAVAQIEEAIVDLLPYLTPKLRKSFEDEWRLITSARQ